MSRTSRSGGSARRTMRKLRRDRRESALVIPVPAAHAPVGAWRGERPPIVLGGMALHVTVLYPFLPPRRLGAEVERALDRIFTRESFAYTLERVEAFDNAVYLAPEPAAPFVELTHEVWRAWPGYPPYSGAFRSVVPHMTVGYPGEVHSVADLEASLPIEALAEEVHLMVCERDVGWKLRRAYPLG